MPPESEANCITFSPDGRYFASGSSLGDVFYWNLESKKRTRLPLILPESIPDPDSFAEKNRVDMIEFSRDSSLVAAGRLNGELTVWNLKSGSRYDRKIGQKRFRALSFSDSGELAVTTLGGQIQILDSIDGSPKAYISNSYMTMTMTYLPNSNDLLVGGFDRSIRRYDTSRVQNKKISQPEHHFRGHLASVVSLAASDDGETFVSTDDFGELRIWSKKESQ